MHSVEFNLAIFISRIFKNVCWQHNANFGTFHNSRLVTDDLYHKITRNLMIVIIFVISRDFPGHCIYVIH